MKNDYDSLFAFYDRLNRQRKLLPHEERRVVELARGEKHARAMRDYYARTKDDPERKKKLAEKDARYYQRHKDKCLAVRDAYRKKNPEKNAEACRRYRERRKLAKEGRSAGITE